MFQNKNENYQTVLVDDESITDIPVEVQVNYLSATLSESSLQGSPHASADTTITTESSITLERRKSKKSKKGDNKVTTISESLSESPEPKKNEISDSENITPTTSLSGTPPKISNSSTETNTTNSSHTESQISSTSTLTTTENTVPADDKEDHLSDEYLSAYYSYSYSEQLPDSNPKENETISTSNTVNESQTESTIIKSF